MEWRVSCATLWNTSTCEKPTPHSRNTPSNAAHVAVTATLAREAPVAGAVPTIVAAPIVMSSCILASPRCQFTLPSPCAPCTSVQSFGMSGEYLSRKRSLGHPAQAIPLRRRWQVSWLAGRCSASGLPGYPVAASMPRSPPTVAGAAAAWARYPAVRRSLLRPETSGTIVNRQIALTLLILSSTPPFTSHSRRLPLSARHSATNQRPLAAESTGRPRYQAALSPCSQPSTAI